MIKFIQTHPIAAIIIAIAIYGLAIYLYRRYNKTNGTANIPSNNNTSSIQTPAVNTSANSSSLESFADAAMQQNSNSAQRTANGNTATSRTSPVKGY